MGKSAKAAAPFSHAEFDALPYSVQRKYFSSLERLRIAEQQSAQEQCQQRQQHRPLDISRRSSRSRTPSITLHRSLTFGATRRRLRKAESVRQEHEISQLEAQFFLSLPQKLRKQHFSREEQVLLIGRCDQPPPRAQQRFNDFDFDFYNDPDGALERGRSRRRSRSIGSISPTRVLLDGDEQVADAPESLIHLDPMGPPTSHQGPRPSSFRRTLSLTNIPVRNSTSSAPPTVDPPFFSFSPIPWHQRSTSLSQSGRRSSHTPTAPVFDPEATHYQDPEARKKLRMFLASPQKFDEAVEFGFPSAAGGDAIPPRYQLPPITTDARKFSHDMQTFLRDDRMSFLDNDDDDMKSESDGESMTDGDSPLTPSSAGLSFRCHTRHASPSNLSSLDSTNLPPMHSAHGHLTREMTLRMTLTRPDLRADKEQLYGWQNQGTKDPFALEELHLSDDMTGSKGAFAVKSKPHGNLVSRLFKRASMKGR